jgi:hypothetical protein
MTAKSLERPIHMAFQTFFLLQLSKMGYYTWYFKRRQV